MKNIYAVLHYKALHILTTKHLPFGEGYLTVCIHIYLRVNNIC